MTTTEIKVKGPGNTIFVMNLTLPRGQLICFGVWKWKIVPGLIRCSRRGNGVMSKASVTMLVNHVKCQSQTSIWSVA